MDIDSSNTHSKINHNMEKIRIDLNINTNSNIQTKTDPCEDMDSYDKGVSFGRLQKGGLPDCDTYYYEGAATNKDCWCKGFIEGQK